MLQTNRQGYRHTDNVTDIQTYRQGYGHTDKDTDKGTDIHNGKLHECKIYQVIGGQVIEMGSGCTVDRGMWDWRERYVDTGGDQICQYVPIKTKKTHEPIIGGRGWVVEMQTWRWVIEMGSVQRTWVVTWGGC